MPCPKRHSSKDGVSLGLHGDHVGSRLDRHSPAIGGSPGKVIVYNPNMSIWEDAEIEHAAMFLPFNFISFETLKSLPSFKKK